MYTDYELIELINTDRLSIGFLETIVSAIHVAKASNQQEEYIKLCGWQDDEMISITIGNFDEALENILTYFIRYEEYELCEELINIKNGMYNE